MENNTEITRFEVGKTYATRSACNHDCVYEFTVIRRTPKFLHLDDGHGKIERRGVYVYNGAENCKPHGTYSMAPIITAGEDELIEGGIRHEVESKACRAAAEASATVPTSNPELEGMGSNRAMVRSWSEKALKDLITAGFTPSELRDMGPDRMMKEVEALYRRASFHVVAG